MSAPYFPYFECIERLPADVELRFNYLHRNRVPGNGRTDDILLKLVKKGHSLYDSGWKNPEVTEKIFEAMEYSDRDQIVAVKTNHLASFLSNVGVDKTVDDVWEVKPGQDAHNLKHITGSSNSRCMCWSFSHGTRLHLMTDGETLLWISNRPFTRSMDTCPMHCGVCESMTSVEDGREICDRCPVYLCVHFKRF
ncbi:hypothetical protein PMAYCL1PPCAC_25055 [Pristionchus mayeri]|uniref:Uncharacterized protein n=1 Tax=Pristionchus mayeri TaxID=1317129 RepID=A0AAN5D2G9_9BILA|nr:hypothetical protein PMAYCL1PPCAC_25055 [Pristionchus mayeri]